MERWNARTLTQLNIVIYHGDKMPTMVRFEDIKAWQTARELTRLVYELGYVDQSELERLFDLADKCSRQISRFMTDLERQRKNV